MFKCCQTVDTIVCPNSISNECIRIPTWANTMPYVPPVTSGYVIKVYDGDTITIATKVHPDNDMMYRFSVRLRGIDCPEMKSSDESERERAKIAQKEMSDLCLNQTVQLKNVDLDKYGRLLADVYLHDYHLNMHMLNRNLAVPYDGKTKES